MRALAAQFARFGTVGALGWLVDVAVFNLLWLTVLSPDEVDGGAFWAKVISTSVAILFNWLGNRYWTFRHHRRRDTLREGIEFLVASLLGMLVALGCLWVSREVLGFTSLLADNVASNVIGLGLGALLRFVLYRNWVYAPHRAASARPAQATAHAAQSDRDKLGRPEALDQREATPAS
ncbi:GtrA family protein [Diaminobutyricimonas sp. LJ205]|uniref:GtrA family protein n=1 Tax=Diaminobutyricimonas sp. LJ205 TaxID=2683590 RepID=UPI0012F50938|nr:GtrA family protein [Diaminobutyricimonas sp. LJ205]